jgi:large conductance mechanosensitive channel
MLTEFRDFIMRGNLVDLAIAVVIAAAFGTVVAALVADLITPLIAAIGGEPDFNSLDFKINGSTFRYGHFLNTVISFLIIAAVVFFLVIRPFNAQMERLKSKRREDAVTRECPECLSDIPAAAGRCAFCTAEVPRVAVS